MKKILLISNQCPNEEGIGNPIMTRMLKALKSSREIEKADFMPFENSIGSLLRIRRASKKFDIIHVHFGGLYALLVRLSLLGTRKTTFITFHGTDIHAKSLANAKSARQRVKIRLNQKASFLCISLYDKCGFVAKEMLQYIPKTIIKRNQGKFFLQPLGVDYEVFKITDKDEAKDMLKLPHCRYVLFSDVSNTKIKRRDIALDIIKELGSHYTLLTMSGVKPDEVPYYINACDFAILTSDEEGSPNIIREVLALNKPFFSVDVGDAATQLKGLTNSAIISRNSSKAARTILEYMAKPYIDNTRVKLQEKLDFSKINKIIIQLYEQS